MAQSVIFRSLISCAVLASADLSAMADEAGAPAAPPAQTQPVPVLPDATGLDPGGRRLPMRFQFVRAGDGVLRLDRENGAVSICSQHSVGWACQAVPDDRTALEQEIARLLRENDALRNEIAIPKPVPPVLSPAEPSPATQQLPPALDVARARGWLTEAWRRLVEAVAQARRDLVGKG